MQNKDYTPKRPFSILIYVLIVFGISWPFQIIGAIWAIELASLMSLEPLWIIYIFNSISMIMVTVGTFIAGKYIFKDGFKDAGWNWGKPIHYLLVIGFVLILWLFPTIIDVYGGLLDLPPNFSWIQFSLFTIGLIIITIIPGFGEEFGWRGYMLPHLAERFSPKKAVFVHNFIWWAWHIPVLAMGWIYVAINLGMEIVAIQVTLGMIVTLIGQGVIFAYIWTRSQSLGVSTVFHATHNGVKDSITLNIGLGPLTGLYTSFFMVIIGVALLWKGSWKNLETKENPPKISKIEQ